MSYETVTTLLLLLLAVLVGAFLGCLLRRWSRSPSVEVDTGTSDTVESATASSSEAVTPKPAVAPLKPVDVTPKHDFTTSEDEPRPGQEETPDHAEAETPKPLQARGLTAAVGGKADDLKILRGIGPKLEKTLNGLGIFHFEQIAGWSAEDVGEVDDLLSFKGRIERDQWIDQAKKLMNE